MQNTHFKTAKNRFSYDALLRLFAAILERRARSADFQSAEVLAKPRTRSAAVPSRSSHEHGTGLEWFETAGGSDALRVGTPALRGFENGPAVSPISNRQAGEPSGGHGTCERPQAGSPARQQIGNLRYESGRARLAAGWAGVLLLAATVMPMVAQSINLHFGRIQGDLTLNPGSGTAVDTFFTPAEGVVVGSGVVAGTYPISGRSPVAGDKYLTACPSGSLISFLGINTVPLQPLPTESVTPKTGNHRAGEFLMLPPPSRP